MTGLSVDLGRMYIAQNEAQSYADSVALFAGRALDGELTGITTAQSMPGSNPKTWHMGTEAFTGTTVSFSGTPDGPWTTPTDDDMAGPMKAVQVVARATVPLYFLPVLVRSTTSRVSARAVAFNAGIYGPGSGLFPFVVLSRHMSGFAVHDSSDKFGLQVGRQYTLRWDNKNEYPCEGDDEASVLAFAQSRDWGDIGSIGKSASSVNDAIDGQGADIRVRTGYYDLLMSSGSKSSEVDHLEDRVNRDSDHISTEYSDYMGDGTRVVVCPITDGTQSGGKYRCVGFAAFLLQMPEGKNKPKGHTCGEYLGNPFAPGTPTPSLPPLTLVR